MKRKPRPHVRKIYIYDARATTSYIELLHRLLEMSSLTLQDQIAAIEVTKDEYISRCLPRRMGNIFPIAYGGCTTAIAVYAACQSVDESFHIFSVLGSFHGPTKIDRKLKCHVLKTRQTRTFATRRVVAYQTQDDGSDRTCADIFVDFHVSETGTYEYSAPPSEMYRAAPEDPLKTISRSDLVEKLTESGYITRELADAHTKTFAMAEEFFESRHCLDGVSGQNSAGLIKDLATTQDNLRIDEKTSAEWFRARKPLENQAEHAAALAFLLDGALSFLPLHHDHKDLSDVGPTSTLDFAVRILVPEIRVNLWLLRERKTIAAYGAKTYSESRVWNQSGRMVAIVTQTSICRLPNRPGNVGAKL